MDYNRLLINFKAGVDALLANRFRAFLTSLGIIFGVASVIAMLAIGNGAEKQILKQMKEVGVNNIIIKPKAISQSSSQQGQSDADEGNTESNNSQKGSSTKRNTSPGLSLKDAENMMAVIPSINYVSPEVQIQTEFIYKGNSLSGNLIGVNNHFFEIAQTKVATGKFFSAYQLDHASTVCIIGKNISTRLFPTANPIGEYIKCGDNWLKVVGILRDKSINKKDLKKLAIRDINSDIYIPIKTMLLRYKNRSFVSIADILKEDRRRGKTGNGNYNQLDRMVVNVKKTSLMVPSTNLISRLLLRRHHDIRDFKIIVPQLLLKQEQKTKRLFNIVLAVIASISLLVGGIGIMNIMLASVLERTKEIGLRLAIGATKKDIVTQFVSESVCISVTGGIIGVLLGVLLSYIIQQTTDIETIVSLFSIIISFTISIAIGLIFGIFPAKRASRHDPVVALRVD